MDLRLELRGFLCTDSHCAVVYKGVWHHRGGKRSDVAVKKMVLKTGLFFDRHTNKHFHDGRAVSSDAAQRAFRKSPDGAFLIRRQSSSLASFQRQVEKTKQMHAWGLGPAFFGAWTDKQDCIHYGFIVTALLDGTVKTVMLQRRLTEREDARVQDAVRGLHDARLTHGSLKPGNIGVLLDTRARIRTCLFLDVGAMKSGKRADGRRQQLDLQKYELMARKHARQREKRLAA